MFAAFRGFRTDLGAWLDAFRLFAAELLGYRAAVSDLQYLHGGCDRGLGIVSIFGDLNDSGSGAKKNFALLSPQHPQIRI